MPADYCGPFTIDDIDLFGTLDQLNVSFDDPIWNSADTCIHYADGVIAGTGNVTAAAYAVRDAVGAINATGTVISLGRILGDEWADETAGTESWSPETPSADIWADKSIGNQTWQ